METQTEFHICRVPHPGRALCAMGGKPQKPAPQPGCQAGDHPHFHRPFGAWPRSLRQRRNLLPLTHRACLHAARARPGDPRIADHSTPWAQNGSVPSLRPIRAACFLGPACPARRTHAVPVRAALHAPHAAASTQNYPMHSHTLTRNITITHLYSTLTRPLKTRGLFSYTCKFIFAFLSGQARQPTRIVGSFAYLSWLTTNWLGPQFKPVFAPKLAEVSCSKDEEANCIGRSGSSGAGRLAGRRGAGQGLLARRQLQR